MCHGWKQGPHPCCAGLQEGVLTAWLPASSYQGHLSGHISPKYPGLPGVHNGRALPTEYLLQAQRQLDPRHHHTANGKEASLESCSPSCISQRGHGGQVRGAKSWAPEGARFRSPTLNTCLTTPQAKLLITPSMGCPAQPNHTEAILPGFHTLPGTKSNSLAMPASPGPCLPQHFLLSGQSPWFPAGPSQARLAGKAPPLWRHPGLSSCSKLILHMFRLKAQAQGRSRLTV